MNRYRRECLHCSGRLGIVVEPRKLWRRLDLGWGILGNVKPVDRRNPPGWVRAALYSVPFLAFTTIRVLLGFADSSDRGFQNLVTVASVAAVMSLVLLAGVSLLPMMAWVRHRRLTDRFPDANIFCGRWTASFVAGIRKVRGGIPVSVYINSYGVVVGSARIGFWSGGFEPREIGFIAWADIHEVTESDEVARNRSFGVALIDFQLEGTGTDMGLAVSSRPIDLGIARTGEIRAFVDSCRGNMGFPRAVLQ